MSISCYAFYLSSFLSLHGGEKGLNKVSGSMKKGQEMDTVTTEFSSWLEWKCRVPDDSEISSLSDWRIRTEKLEGAGLGKEDDRCAFAYMEFEFWVAFQLEVFSFGEISELVMYIWNLSS